MANTKIRQYASEKNVHLWEIAMKLNITDGNFSRKLRKELPDEEVSKILFYVDQISAEKEREV